MSIQTPAVATDVRPLPEAADVEAFLRQHPGFLAERPALLRSLTPPTRFDGDDAIADFQAAIIAELRADLDQLSQSSVDLLSMTRSNLTQQQRTHAAALMLVEAATPAEFHRVLTQEWPRLLDVDAIALVLEDDAAPHPMEGPQGISRVPAGTVDRLFAAAPGARVLLTPERAGSLLFGTTICPIRSDALARLDEPATWEPGGGSTSVAPGLLAVGSFRPQTFHPDQATDLLEFLARLVAIVLARWCAPTP